MGIVAGRSVGNSEVGMMEGRGAETTDGSADNIVLKFGIADIRTSGTGFIISSRVSCEGSLVREGTQIG